MLFIKKFKDFKQQSPDYRQTVMHQIEKTMQLQSIDAGSTVRIIKYLIADNNLYVVMQHCSQSIKGLLRSHRILQQAETPTHFSIVSGDRTIRTSSIMDPWEATEHIRLASCKENSLAIGIGDDEFVVMLIIQDCLRLLKLLSKSNPTEAVYLGADNLFIMNGQVCLCDPFLNRTRLLSELIKLKAKNNEAKAREDGESEE